MLKRSFALIILFLFICSCTFSAQANEDTPTSYISIGILGNLDVTQEQINSAKVDDKFDFSPAFIKIRPFLDDLDYTTAFLGIPISNDVPENAVFAPKEFAKAIKGAGIDFLAAASGDSYKNGEKGIKQTIDVLDEYNIDYAGISHEKEQKNYVIRDIKGIRLAFFSYTHDLNFQINSEKMSEVSVLDFGNSSSFIRKNLALPSYKHIRKIEKEISRVRKEVDYIFVFSVFDEQNNEIQKIWQDTMIRAGADFVIARSGNGIKPLDYRVRQEENNPDRRILIFNSIGNLSLSDGNEESDNGVMFVLNLGKTGDTLRFKALQAIPLYIDNGTATPIYREIKNGNPQNERLKLLKNADSKVKDIFLGETDTRPPKKIYTLFLNIKNIEKSDDNISLYRLSLLFNAAAAAMIIVTLVLLIFIFIRFVKTYSHFRR